MICSNCYTYFYITVANTTCRYCYISNTLFDLFVSAPTDLPTLPLYHFHKPSPSYAILLQYVIINYTLLHYTIPHHNILNKPTPLQYTTPQNTILYYTINSHCTMIHYTTPLCNKYYSSVTNTTYDYTIKLMYCQCFVVIATHTFTLL